MKDDNLRYLFHIIFNWTMGYCMVLWAGGCNYYGIRVLELFIIYIIIHIIYIYILKVYG